MFRLSFCSFKDNKTMPKVSHLSMKELSRYIWIPLLMYRGNEIVLKRIMYPTGITEFINLIKSHLFSL